MERSDCCRRARAGAARQLCAAEAVPCPEEGSRLSERSERAWPPVASAADAVLADAVAASDRLAPLRRTRRPRPTSSGALPIRMPSAHDRPAHGRLASEVLRQRKYLVAEPTDRGELIEGGLVRGRIDRAPLLGRRGRRVLRRDGCGSLRGRVGRQTGGLRRVVRSANALTALAQERSLLRTWHRLRSTVLLCCCGSRSPAAVASRTGVASPYAPSSLRGRARSQFHDWRRCWRPPSAFLKGAVGGRRRRS